MLCYFLFPFHIARDSSRPIRHTSTIIADDRKIAHCAVWIRQDVTSWKWLTWWCYREFDTVNRNEWIWENLCEWFVWKDSEVSECLGYSIGSDRRSIESNNTSADWNVWCRMFLLCVEMMCVLPVKCITAVIANCDWNLEKHDWDTREWIWDKFLEIILNKWRNYPAPGILYIFTLCSSVYTSICL